MKVLLGLFVGLLVLACATPLDHTPPDSFPETYLFAGSDADRSFRSVLTRRQDDGTITAYITGWGIREYGLFLHSETNNEVLKLDIWAICGTVTSETYVKRTFEYALTRAQEDSLSQIQYAGFVIGK